jgi:predicted dehydrogenase
MRLSLGMIGGGEGAFIGAVHRMAARLDDRWTLVAGAFSSDPDRSRAFGQGLGLNHDRSYGDWQAMARAEAARPDHIDAVAIVTPNHLHHAPALAFLEAGIAVICDKPLTTSLDQALDLAGAVDRSGAPFVLTHNYSGYPMVRQARAMVAQGELGEIRLIQVEYPQDWLSTKIEDSGQKQATWRMDPARAGAGGALGDVGSHAEHLARYVTGLQLTQVCADISTILDGRQLDDNAHVMLRYANGARGLLWCSQVAPGNENNLKLRVYGSKAGLEFRQENPNQLWFSPLGETPRLLTRAGASVGPAASQASRLPAGHPEGYLEGFAQLYRDVAEQLHARWQGRSPDPLACTVPTVEDGLLGMQFIAAAVASSKADGRWVEVG